MTRKPLGLSTIAAHVRRCEDAQKIGRLPEATLHQGQNYTKESERENTRIPAKRIEFT